MLSLVAPLLLTAAAAAATRRSESNGCNTLSDNVPNTIFFRGDDVYEYENTRFWSNNEIMDPECVFRPSSADEVAQAVQIMQDTNTQFAVRGGGHMAIRVCAIVLYLYPTARCHGILLPDLANMMCLGIVLVACVSSGGNFYVDPMFHNTPQYEANEPCTGLQQH